MINFYELLLLLCFPLISISCPPGYFTESTHCSPCPLNYFCLGGPNKPVSCSERGNLSIYYPSAYINVVMKSCNLVEMSSSTFEESLSTVTTLQIGSNANLRGRYLEDERIKTNHDENGNIFPIVNIFIICYNDIVLLPRSIAHYRKYLPHATITILDNESTDGTPDLAQSLGCEVYSFSTMDKKDEYMNIYLKNNIWKNITDGWIIMVDIDEWLCVTEQDLLYEESQHTSILRIYGNDVLGHSQDVNLTDIDVHNLRLKTDNKFMNKSLCFYRPLITDMNYRLGAHKSVPMGTIIYSHLYYQLKHMVNLGLPFLIHKIISRYTRTEMMRHKGLSRHYTNNTTRIIQRYIHYNKTATPFDGSPFIWWHH